MGFINSLKRLFFATESVAKSAVDKSVDFTKEKAGDLSDAVKQKTVDIDEKTSGLRQTVMQKAEVAMHKLEDIAEDAVEKAKDLAEDVSDLAEAGFDKAKAFGGIALDKAKDLAEDVSDAAESGFDKAKAFGGIALDKEKDLAEDVPDVVDSEFEKAKAFGGIELDKEKDLAEDVPDVVDSEFDKAKAFGGTELDKVGDVAHSVEDGVGGLGDTTLSMESKMAIDGGSIFDEAKTKADRMMHSTKDSIAATYDKISDSDVVKKTVDFTEEVGSRVMHSGNDMLGKAGEFSENVGAKVIDKSSKAMDILSEAKDALLEKSKQIGGDINRKFNETVDKAEKFMAEEAAKPVREFAEDTLDASKPLLGGTDDFFNKAAHYADGDYGAFSEGKITISNATPSSSKPVAKVAGQEDHDGDGNEQIDDAIIVES